LNEFREKCKIPLIKTKRLLRVNSKKRDLRKRDNVKEKNTRKMKILKVKVFN